MGDAASPWNHWLARLRPRRALERDVPAEAVPPAAADVTMATCALPKFLAALSTKSHPLVLDLGPVVGANVTFFGEHGCRVRVEDLAADLDGHARAGAMARLPEFFGHRFPQAPGSVDGILCWDLFDYVDRPGAQALSAALSRLLAPDGRLLAFFGTTDRVDAGYTKYIVADRSTLRPRAYPSVVRRRRGLLTGDIIKLFANLRITDSFLMKSTVREMLFRNPACRV